MNLPAWCIAPILGISASVAGAANATHPVDYRQRNATFAPQGSIQPQTRSPAPHPAIGGATLPLDVRDMQTSPAGDRRAGVPVAEAEPKVLTVPPRQRPETREQPVSAWNGRRAAVSTAADTRSPPRVARYQDSLAAASAANMARFPALAGAAKATINRFVFRKNGAEPASGAVAAPVVPAAGASPVVK